MGGATNFGQKWGGTTHFVQEWGGDAVDVVLQVLVDLDPLFSRRTKFVPKMSGVPKVRQIARIFPSDLNNINIFT